MCSVHACIRTTEIQVYWPFGSQAPGSEVRLMTSTEHPGGKGLNLHAIQIAPDSIPHCY